MSQIIKLSEGTVAPDVEKLTGDTGGAVGPDGAFNINILGGTGVTVVGNPATHTLTITEDNKLEGTGQTVGAVTADLITLDLGTTPGIYTFDTRIAGFDAADSLGIGYTLVGAVRTDGAASVVLPSQALDQFEELALIGATAVIVAVGNTAVIRVTGVAAKTINWSADAEYVFVS